MKISIKKCLILCLICVQGFFIFSSFQRATEKSKAFTRELEEKHKQFSNEIKQFVSSSQKKFGCRRFIEKEVSHDEPYNLVFMSFSLPDSLWLELSASLEKKGGRFVLRGLPSNSFQELHEKIKVLKQKGMRSPVDIDPKSFDRYGIDQVPSFVRVSGDSFDKMAGSVSLDYFLEQVEKEGDCKKSNKRSEK